MSDLALACDSLVPKLRTRMRARLSELETEAGLLRNALAALDEPVILPRRHRAVPGRRGPADAVIDVIAEAPGSRVSMIALATARNPDEIRATLELLHSEQRVRRDGLGWALVPP